MKYRIKGLDCADCAQKLEDYLNKSDIVKNASISFATETIIIDFKIEDENNLIEINRIAKLKEENVKILEINNSETEYIQEYTNLKKRKTYMFISLFLFIISLFLEFFMQKYLKYDANMYILYIPIYILSYIIVGLPILKDAIISIKKGDFFNEKVLMSISTIAAFLIREYEEATAVMLFYTLGEYFQEISILKSRKGIKQLLELKENTVHIFKDEEIIDKNVEDIKLYDKIYIKPGESILFDGKILVGKSKLDTSMITGESIPRFYEENDEVLAGMINLSSPLIIEVSKNFDDSSISKIVEMVENSAHKKSNMEKFITRFSKNYTPIVFNLAFLITVIPPIFFQRITFIDSLYNGIIFLVISCPCALVLSIPLTFFSGIGKAASEGILIKGANVFDNIYKVKKVFLDKTGTITEGKFKVNLVFENLENTNMELKKIYEHVYKAEKESNHPIAKSIIEFISKKYNLIDFKDEEHFKEYISLCNHCGCCHDVKDHINDTVFIRNHNDIGHYEGDKCISHDKTISEDIAISKDFAKNLKIWNLSEISGLGIDANISGKRVLIGKKELLLNNKIEVEDIKDEDKDNSTVVYVAIDNVFVMIFVIKDKIRKDTLKAIELMRKSGIQEIVMLTGDNYNIAKEVSQNLKIDRFYSNLLPEDKLKIVEKEKGNIMFIGDGINDAPVISIADVGVAMGKTGQDITIETADIVLNTDSLTKISQLINLGNKMKSIVYQNLFIILSIKIFVIILGAFSFMSMWVAVFADVGVSIIAILNAMKVRKIKI